MNIPIRVRWWVLLLALLGGVAGACQICVPLPERTLADRLLASRAVVLAREDPQRPFHYRAIETLAGTPDGAPTELFLNSQARRTLAAHPQRAMVVAQSAKDGGWSTLGLITPEYERVVRAILRQDLIAWQRWDFVRQVKQARDALGADPLAAYSLGRYLRFAQAKQVSRAPQWRTGTEAPAASDRTELGETP